MRTRAPPCAPASPVPLAQDTRLYGPLPVPSAALVSAPGLRSALQFLPLPPARVLRPRHLISASFSPLRPRLPGLPLRRPPLCPLQHCSQPWSAVTPPLQALHAPSSADMTPLRPIPPGLATPSICAYPWPFLSASLGSCPARCDPLLAPDLSRCPD